MKALSVLALLCLAAVVSAQGPEGTQNPYTKPIEEKPGIILRLAEFASIPATPGQSQAARMMIMLDEPQTRRLFVNDMVGPLYTVSYDGKTVTEYLNVNDPKWGYDVESRGPEQGVQSFTIHPEFNQRGKPGYGKLYTYSNTSKFSDNPDFRSPGTQHASDIVLLEWTAKNPAASRYDGGKPRELLRWAQPFGNHNGGHVTFNPLAKPGDEDYGLLYFGVGDGGSGGDPFKSAQNLGRLFGKIMRINPLGSNSPNGKYGIPAGNPFTGRQGALGEIYAYGIRNVQRIFWDSKTKTTFASDIGQNAIEEITTVPRGANLGWNVWEGDLRFDGRRGVILGESRADKSVTYPVAEYDHVDPLLQGNVATIGGFVYRDSLIPEINGKLLFGDLPSGEVFFIDADRLPSGGQDAIRRILFDVNGSQKTFLQIIQAKNTQQGIRPANRADVRFGLGPNGRRFLLNKRDGVIRELVSMRKK